MIIRTLILACLVAGLLVPAGLTYAEYCSCSSAYCSTSVSCEAACYAVCGTTCSSGCSGGGGPGSGPLVRPPAGLWSLPQELSLSEYDQEPESISTLLSDQLGAEVTFASSDDTLTLDIKRMPTTEMLEALAKHGAVAIYQGNGEAVDRPRAAGSSTLLANGAGAAALSTALSALLEREVVFQPHGGEALDIEVKGMPVYQLLEILKQQGSLQVGP